MNKVIDIKQVVASNLIKYRKEAKMTQSQVAEKLNYSDKAISKWERGESLPDVYVLKQIADIYGVELDDMLHETTAKEKIQSFYRNRAVISILSVLLVWLVAMLVFVVLEIVIPNAFPTYLCFIYAIPAAFIVALVFNNLWGGRIYNMIIVSGIDWGVALSAVMTCEQIVKTEVAKPWWYIYFIAAIFEVMVILWYLLNIGKKKPKVNSFNKEEEIEEEKEEKEEDDKKADEDVKVEPSTPTEDTKTDSK